MIEVHDHFGAKFRAEISGITPMAVGSKAGGSSQGGRCTGGRGSYGHGSCGGDTSQVLCFQCHELGHFASNCTADLATIQVQLAQEQEDTKSQYKNVAEDTSGVQLVQTTNSVDPCSDTSNISYSFL